MDMSKKHSFRALPMEQDYENQTIRWTRKCDRLTCDHSSAECAVHEEHDAEEQ